MCQFSFHRVQSSSISLFHFVLSLFVNFGSIFFPSYSILLHFYISFCLNFSSIVFHLVSIFHFVLNFFFLHFSISYCVKFVSIEFYSPSCFSISFCVKVKTDCRGRNVQDAGQLPKTAKFFFRFNYQK
jgi:hypothetical protein